MQDSGNMKKILAIVMVLIFFPVINNGYAKDLAFCTDIADGDTVFVKINNRDETVRLIGVNTPEIDGKYVNEEYFGKEASQFTKKLVKRKKVRLEYDIEKRDKYNRLLAYVYLPDGKMLNRILVKKGYAKAYKFFKYKMKKEFIRLEKAAKVECLGLWRKFCDR